MRRRAQCRRDGMEEGDGDGLWMVTPRNTAFKLDTFEFGLELVSGSVNLRPEDSARFVPHETVVEYIVDPCMLQRVSDAHAFEKEYNHLRHIIILGIFNASMRLSERCPGDRRQKGRR